MTEATHTPGPWEVQRPSFDGYATIRGDGPIAAIAYRRPENFEARPGGDLPEPEAEANARLIAAAPELLRALKGMILNDTHTYRDCHKQALAAIAKAEGRS